MFGILTDDPELARSDIGDVTYYFTNYVDGTCQPPLDGAISSVACWGDTATVSDEPDRAAVAADGTRAASDVEGHHWGTVCPTDPDYRAEVLERIGRVGAAGDVRLTTLGFPGASFCHCDRCDRLFAASEFADRNAWRTSVITEFVADAADCVAGDLVTTLYPDPYPGNLRERAGLDPRALASAVDEFLVPLCGVSYETTYWVESLARGFARELEGVDATVTIQLATDGIDADRLVGLTRQLEPHAKTIVYGTHPDDEAVVREVIRRVRDAETAPRVA
ncbi:hypothetical protein GS429_06200 [Natronorubrum sp. JWXQ-INN-674]|uniref:Uncharacterized protein n=1 Tax=Natronorubrum halalkaliphilum TaxID=2691917 RepID=A0A6B0VJD9_9EURY|nr:hypothetical protein [Natronorubrum halalkaliphilum]MXV61660.1 hypothetical protein [Natronorubrum halalkaliphilum]